MFLAVNPAWVSVAFTACALFGVPILWGTYHRISGLFIRLDKQDSRVEENRVAASSKQTEILEQVVMLSSAQREANGKVGVLQMDVAMLKGTVYGKDAPHMGGKQ